MPGKITRLYGPDEWLQGKPSDALKGIPSPQGSDDHSGGGGIAPSTWRCARLDLYQCVRPVQYLGCAIAAEEIRSDQHGHLPGIPRHLPAASNGRPPG